MFSPYVFVYVYVCYDVCPGDLIMKDWCHTNNILRVHSWWCLFVQAHAKETIFHGDDVIDDVTGWPQIRPFIFLYKWNKNICHDK